MQIIWNSEIEFPLFKKVGISGVVFFDSGNAYNLEERYCGGSAESSDISPKFDPCFRLPESITQGLRYSVGFGFRWLSPIGPLRFEWGIPLDRQPGQADAPRAGREPRDGAEGPAVLRARRAAGGASAAQRPRPCRGRARIAPAAAAAPADRGQ